MAVKKSASARKSNTSAGKKQTTVKKTQAKKSAAKKPAAKKAPAKKTETKKVQAKKAVAKKPEAKKEVKKKAPSFVASPDIKDKAFLESTASFLSGNACFYNRELS